ncbi:uncharacterized protein LOC142981457 [Anticarsia gemmatalis]|uniref:uncharacterized protein LOC142981457 n=1 Tax=Anticarsia gemmatalis TaxID=129554 RepID=UPI003F75FB9D
MEWSRDTILHFINLVKERRAFWDYQSPEYKIKRKRQEAIEEVALLMGIPPKEVNTKWVILRNQYSRERRKITECTSDTPYVTKWYAYSEMDALLSRNKRLTNYLQNFWTQESRSDDEDSSNSPPSPPAASARGSRQAVTSTDNGKDTTSVAQNPQSTTCTISFYNEALKTLKAMRDKNDTSDELTNYGLYIAAHLKKLSPPLQSRAKYEINKILYALDLESLEQYTAAIPSTDTISEGECKFDPLQSQKDME